MFLKALTMKGFKSFADTTRLDLEPGVTVVVGPNGSGKSNVVDAVTWVLGAQGPRTLRSQKMDDVIFAGTTRRPALGRAEVSLTLDNSAGLLPLDVSEVSISRTLFRTGDSEYAINGVPCRLLDIQDLLSDAGVGRQQHVIIAQGQIDQVLNARPEERRLIIEEAAGVLKFRKRKERSERRLASTEANLLRLQDLQREVRRQLRPLERQAEAARRHGELVTEVRALQLFVSGRDLAAQRARLEGLEAERVDLRDRQRAIRDELAGLDVEITTAEAGLAATGDDVTDVLRSFESVAERCRGTLGVLAERRRSTERERDVLLAEDLVASLEADAAEVRAGLVDVAAAEAALEPEARELAEAEALLSADQSAHELRDAQQADAQQHTLDVAGRAAEVRGEVGALRSAVERMGTDRGRAGDRLGDLDARIADLTTTCTTLRARLADATDAEPPLVQAVDRAEAAVVATDADAAEATEACRTALDEQRRWHSRAEALRLALDEARARAGAERLADLDGAVGTLLELVEIDDGWGPAFEAAVGDALAAVVVESDDVARQALQRLADAGERGAVLALGQGGGPTTPALVGDPVRNHVRSPRPDVEALLDRLVGDAVAVDGDWSVAADLALTHAGLTVVTRSGDRFGPAGWRLGAGTSGATGAALDEAVEREEAAGAAFEVAQGRLNLAEAALAEARRELAARTTRLDDNDAEMTAAGEELLVVETSRRDAETEAASLRQRAAEIDAGLERDRSRLAELEALLPDLEADEEAGRAAAAEEGRRRDELGRRAATVAAMRADLGMRAAGLEERRGLLAGRLAEIESRLATYEAERAGAEERRARLDAQLAALDRLTALVQDRQRSVAAEVTRLRERRRQQSEAVRAAADALETLRARRSQAETELESAREALGRTDVTEAEVKLRLEAVVDTLRRELDVDPDTALVAECPPLPDGVTAKARLRELEVELRRMGPINALALEEYEALKERHEFVADQLDDVKQSRKELQKVIAAIDEEIVQVFAAAFADVSSNFEQLFQTLFPGGRGGLKLTDPGNLLETGVEIDARPSGKNVRKLSLLSGGERSLTALAYLFAIFRSRPSPFYVMDEVEAALDDVNLHRFLSLVDEFRQEAQLVIVSHQKRTMEAADCLYGVSMQPGESSKVVSERPSGSAADAA